MKERAMPRPTNEFRIDGGVPEPLRNEEIRAFREFLAMKQSLGVIGKGMLWAILTAGAVAAAWQQLKGAL